MIAINSIEYVLSQIKKADMGEADAISYFKNISLKDVFKNIILTESQIKSLLERFHKSSYSTWVLGYLYLRGLSGFAKDYDKAFSAFTYTIDNGCICATYSLASMYEYGLGVPKDTKKAVELCTIGMNGGNIPAINNLAVMYNKGIGVVQDMKKAIELYEISSNGGNIDATFNLATIYRNGIGVIRDMKKAVELYEIAMNGGDMDATFSLAFMYENGKGVTQDYGRAVELYTIAMNSGIIDSTNNLGVMYENGKGVTQDYGRAVELYTIAMNSGSVDSTNNLARLYENGKGVAQDYAKAINLYNSINHKQAQLLCKKIHNECDLGVALKLFTQIDSTHDKFINVKQIVDKILSIIYNDPTIISNSLLDLILSIDFNMIYGNNEIPPGIIHLKNIFSENIDI